LRHLRIVEHPARGASQERWFSTGRQRPYTGDVDDEGHPAGSHERGESPSPGEFGEPYAANLAYEIVELAAPWRHVQPRP
jgi:hypothetical protein